MMTKPTTKYERLYAAYDQFIQAIAGIDDPLAAMLAASWQSTTRTYAQMLAAGGKTSQLAAGLEQGLRELPMALRAEGGARRADILDALHRSIAAHYPDFFKHDDALLAAIVERSKIRNAKEYHLVRHRIDVLEGDAGAVDECNRLRRLIDRFEA
jgi:hypothetical protein